MSKRFKRKTCTYCVAPASSTVGDHVLAREFCLKHKRDNLPQVPACDRCNGEKSSAEHYLTAVAPFGARHADSGLNLVTLTPPRLLKNRPLATYLGQGLQPRFESNDGLIWKRTATLPFDATKLLALYEFMAQGFAYWHWGIHLPRASDDIQASFVVPVLEALFDKMIASRGARKVSGDLSDGVLAYTGIQDPIHPTLTVWRMSLYGAVLGADPNHPGLTPSRVYILTAPRQMSVAADLIQKMRARAG